MSAPNIVQVSTITAKTAVTAVSTSATNIVANSAGSNTVVKINTLIISNVDGTNSANVTVDLYRDSTAYRIAYTVAVPADSTLVILDKSSGIYLEEGDTLRATASATSDLEAVCSYEIIG